NKTVAQIYVNYNTNFLKNFSVQVMAGGSLERASSNISHAYGRQFIIPYFISLTTVRIVNPAFVEESRLGTNSAFGSIDLSYKSRRYISVTESEDWFSTLNHGFRKILYPSVNSSLIISEAVRLPATFSFVKLRADWAQVGSATLGAAS